jgi:catechol 2,3-dioxygenase-like lactoylglutathione lyase family enzyme
VSERPGAVHHVAIQVRDLARTTAFYRDVLGLAEQRRWPAADGAGDRSVWFDLDGGAFLALERADGMTGAGSESAGWRTETPGLHLLALRISRAARRDWEQRLATAGVAIVHRTPYTLYVRDPEGNRIGLSHWPDEAV